ncbi:MAG: hypothetical protein ACFFAN_04305 [Promethearchaeota archaeon]
MDSKLKSLIKVCKETGNYKKLAVVSFILTSNLLDEIGVKLGIRPRNKDSNETIFRYMKLINSIIENNFNIVIFKENLISVVKEIEAQFLKRKGDIPLKYIIEIYKIYYELRKIEVPNLYESYKSNLISRSSDLNTYYMLSGKKKRSKQNSDKIKPLILHKIRETELSVQKELEKEYNKELFESALYLKKVKSSIKNQEKGKVEIKGRLKENISYQRSLDDILGYSFIGVFILFFLLGLVVVIEAICNPSYTGTLSILLLVTFGPATLFFIIFWNYFRKGD